MRTADTHLDDFEFQHLTDWCERNLRHADAGREAIIAYFIDCDAESAEYSKAHGWWYIADLVGAWTASPAV